MDAMRKNMGWGGRGLLRRTTNATRWVGLQAEEVGKTATRSLAFINLFD